MCVVGAVEYNVVFQWARFSITTAASILYFLQRNRIVIHAIGSVQHQTEATMTAPPPRRSLCYKLTTQTWKSQLNINYN